MLPQSILIVNITVFLLSQRKISDITILLTTIKWKLAFETIMTNLKKKFEYTLHQQEYCDGNMRIILNLFDTSWYVYEVLVFRIWWINNVNLKL